MQWRVIPLETYCASMNMAIDSALMDFVRCGSAPVMRFYRWRPSAVSIGFFQCLEDEVDVALCEKEGIDIVRRVTGGGSVFHAFEGEVTYSLIAPESLFPSSIRDSYALICRFIVDALLKLGLSADFKPINDILVDGQKISGNAQTRKDGVLLQHGTILYSVDAERMFQFLRVNQKKLDAKAIKSVYKQVTSVSGHLDLGIEDLYACLLDCFVKDKQWSFSALTKEEQHKAKDIEASCFLSKEHLSMR